MKLVKVWRIGAMAALLGVAVFGSAVSCAQAKPEKVLRFAFRSAETGFDPVQVSDLYSRNVTANIFDALYKHDYLARPVKYMPNLAVALPEISPDFKTYTVRLKPGVYFADDPVFGGKKRELTAADVVYTYKRAVDPRTKSPLVSDLEEEKLGGLMELRAAAEKPGGKFDYDKEIEGIKALDRYTVQFRMAEASPRFIDKLSDPGIYGIVAREVVEHYGDKIMGHPVGTGPFMLSNWVRSFRIELVRNPNYREVFYDAQPNADDAEGQAMLQRYRGQRLPMVDKVVISPIEEQQPRWLAFLGNEHDYIERVSEQFANTAYPNGKLAPNLAKRGIRMERSLAPDITFAYFNMDDKTVGGYTPEKVALRRAIVLAHNVEEEIRLVRRGQAIPAQGPVMPGRIGYDPHFRSESSRMDRAKAIALLDMYGFVDKDGDGWRDMPDGSPIVLDFHRPPDAVYREIAEGWKKSMNAVGIRIEFKVAQWAEQLKASRTGKMMMWSLGLSASVPDGGGVLTIGYGPQKWEGNLAGFANKDFDRIYEAQKVLPDGPEREALVRQGVKILLAYAPYRFGVHRIITDMTQPWLQGFRRPPFAHYWWPYVDIDTDKLPKK